MRANNAYGGGRKKGRATPGEGGPREERRGSQHGAAGKASRKATHQAAQGTAEGKGGGGASGSQREGGQARRGPGGHPPRDTRSDLYEEGSTEKSGRSSSPHHEKMPTASTVKHSD